MVDAVKKMGFSFPAILSRVVGRPSAEHVSSAGWEPRNIYPTLTIRQFECSGYRKARNRWLALGGAGLAGVVIGANTNTPAITVPSIVAASTLALAFKRDTQFKNCMSRGIPPKDSTAATKVTPTTQRMTAVGLPNSGDGVMAPVTAPTDHHNTPGFGMLEKIVLGGVALGATALLAVAVAEDFFPFAGGPLNDVPAFSVALSSWIAFGASL